MTTKYYILHLTSPRLKTNEFKGNPKRLGKKHHHVREEVLPSPDIDEIMQQSVNSDVLNESVFFEENSIALAQLPEDYNTYAEEPDDYEEMSPFQRLMAAIKADRKQTKEKRRRKKRDKKGAENDITTSEIKPEEKEEKKKKKKFTIWEYIEEEPRSDAEKEVMDVLNFDGFYDTVRPDDYGMEYVKSSGPKRNIIGIVIASLVALVSAAVAIVLINNLG